MGKRIVVAVVLGLIGGLFLGLVASEVIGVVGVLAFDRAAGVKYLPVYLALAGGVIAPLIVMRLSRPKGGRR